MIKIQDCNQILDDTKFLKERICKREIRNEEKETIIEAANNFRECSQTTPRSPYFLGAPIVDSKGVSSSSNTRYFVQNMIVPNSLTSHAINSIDLVNKLENKYI